MTMRMVGLMQEMPNREKRRARADVAHAAIGRAEAAREIEALKVRLVTAQAWIASYAVERKLHLFGELRAENRLLAEAVRARLAGGRGQLTDQVAARQEAAQLAERQDELEQQRRLARAALLRWVGAEGNQPLSGEMPSWPIERQTLLRQLERHPQLSAFAPMAREAQARIREATAEKRGTGAGRSPTSSVVANSATCSTWNSASTCRYSSAAGRTRGSPHATPSSTGWRPSARPWRAIAEQLEAELAELARLQRALARSGELQLPLAREKVELAMSSYRAGRGELDALLAARNELIEARLKHIDLQGLEAIARTRLHVAYGEAK